MDRRSRNRCWRLFGALFALVVLGVASGQPAGSSYGPAFVAEAIAAASNLDAADSEGLTLLQRALLDQWGTEAVAQILDAGADVEAAGEVEFTPVMIALLHPEAFEVVRLLAAAGADVNVRGPENLTPVGLSLMYSRGPQELLELVAAGADLSVLGDEAEVAFWWALARQDRASLEDASSGLDVGDLRGPGGSSAVSVAVRWFPDSLAGLLASGADVDAPNDQGATPLYTALVYGVELGLIHELLDAGANPSADHADGAMPLAAAVGRADAEEAVALLLRYGAMVHEPPMGRSSILHDAVRAGLPASTIAALIHAGADVSIGSSLGGTPLVTELELRARADVVRVLLEGGADPNDTSHMLERSALHLAIAHPDGLAAVRTLLEAGASVDSTSPFHGSPLHAAAVLKSAEIVDLLVQFGAHVDRLDPTRGGAIHEWARRGQFAAVLAALVRAGAGLDLADSHGRTALMVASRSTAAGTDGAPDRLPMSQRVSGLLEVGADVGVRDHAGWSALTHAADACAPIDVLRALSGAGSAIDVRTIDGETSLMAAAAKCGIGPIEALLEAGADVRAVDGRGATLLHHAALNEDAASLMLFLGQGVDLEARARYFRQIDMMGRPLLQLEASTPLLWAAASGTPANVRALVDAGADVRASTANGETALHRAVARDGMVEAATALLRAGASAEARVYGYTPLMVAALEQRDPVVFAALIDAGADIDAVSDEGATPLMLAVGGSGNPVAVEALLEAGAAVHVTDPGGRTAFDRAHANDAVRGSPMYWLLNDARY